MTARVAVFASGSGTNFQALIDAQDWASYRVALLVTDRECGAEERAARRSIDSVRIDMTALAVEEAHRSLLESLQRSEVDAIALAGFLRLVPGNVVEAYDGRILNIHPALLPSFGGKGMYGENVHKAVLASGASLSGPTVHFVNARYDEGAILAQWPVPVLPGDSAASLADRVLTVEHALYPAALDALCASIVGDAPTPTFTWPGSSGDAAGLNDQIRKAFGTP